MESRGLLMPNLAIFTCRVYNVELMSLEVFKAIEKCCVNVLIIIPLSYCWTMPVFYAVYLTLKYICHETIDMYLLLHVALDSMH